LVYWFGRLNTSWERIELTDKESKLLYIFALAPNEIIDREQLQKEVWENEGVIVTRSLDVFISKLRKKLDKGSGVNLSMLMVKGINLRYLLHRNLLPWMSVYRVAAYSCICVVLNRLL
jgi:DNA-binding response OmpR family regulator